MVPEGGDEAETPAHNLIVIFSSNLTRELKKQMTVNYNKCNH